MGGKVWINGYLEFGTLAHELGHSLGLTHASTWTCNDDSVTGAGRNEEYGNPFDVMGKTGAGIPGRYNVVYASQFDWLTAANRTEVTTSGLYRLYAFDGIRAGDGQAMALTIPRPSDPLNRALWLEVRQLFTNNAAAMNSALVQFGWQPRSYQVNSSYTKSQLLDTTPGSSGGIGDAGIAIGRTFRDPYSEVLITPVAKIAGNPAALDIVINRGPFPGNHAPTVLLSANTGSTAPGAPVSFTVTASDSDGDPLAYVWDFGDASLGSNSPTVTKSWATAKDYVVQVEVSDMKGGTTRAKTVVRVGTVTGFRISGQVTIAGQPAAGVRVQAGTAKTPPVAWTDSSGNYTVCNLVAGSISVIAVKAGYTLTPSFTNPVVVSADATGLNFSAATLLVPPAITAQPMSRTVASGTSVTFTTSANGSAPLAYQWRQVHVDGTESMLTGASQASYTIASVDAGMNGRSFRCVVTNAVGGVSTNAAELLIAGVSSPPVFTYQPSDKSVAAPQSTYFITNSNGSPQPRFQWQVKRPGASVFTDLVGETLGTIEFPFTTMDLNGNRYRCVMSNASGVATSQEAMLTVTAGTGSSPVALLRHPEDATVIAPDPATFRIQAIGLPMPTCQWQSAAAGSTTFSDLSGATSTSYSIPTTSLSLNGTRYRCVVSNATGTATSAAAALIIITVDSGPNVPPTITEGSVATLAIAEDTPGTLTLHASDGNVDTITWSVLTQGTKGTAAASGTGTSKLVTYTPRANLNGSDAFVIQVSDGRGGLATITVNVAITPVNDAPVLATAIADQTATVGTTFTYTVPAATFTDVDSSTLTWTSIESLAWLTFNAATRTFSGTPSAADIATTSITVSVSDGLLSASDSFTLTVSPQSNVTNVQLKAVADATINELNANINYGLAQTLYLNNRTGVIGMHSDAVIRFDLSTVDKALVQEATLKLWCTADERENVTETVYLVPESDARENFNETTVTWNSAPALGTSLGTIAHDRTKAKPALYAISPAALREAIRSDTDNVLTIRIRGDIRDGLVLASRQNTTYPTYVPTLSLGLGGRGPVNQVPTCTITSPVTGATFSAPATIAINASASDSDGSISKVEFFNGSTRLGEDTTAPYQIPWSGVVAGSYQITAKATDNTGAVTTSSTVTVSVTEPTFTTLESAGNTSLLQDAAGRYLAKAGTNPAAFITYQGQAITASTFGSEWQLLAIETVAGVNRALWKNVPGRYLHNWTLNNAWGHANSEGTWYFGSAAANAQETTFQIDADGDGRIGAVAVAVVPEFIAASAFNVSTTDALHRLDCVPSRPLLTDGLATDSWWNSSGEAVWDLGAAGAATRQLDAVVISMGNDKSRQAFAGSLAVSRDGVAWTVVGAHTERASAGLSTRVRYAFPAGTVVDWRYLKFIKATVPGLPTWRCVEVDAMVSPAGSQPIPAGRG